MIFDNLSNLDRYRGLSKNLDCGITFLQSADLSALPQGRIEIQGDDIYANHFFYTTAPFSVENLFEDHQKYLDLHVILDGKECFAISPVEDLEFVEFREREDSTMYRGMPKDEVSLSKGLFLLVYPKEAHLPKLLNEHPSEVDKLVLKIAL